MTRHRILFWSGAGCLAWGLMGCSIRGPYPAEGTPKGSESAPANNGELRTASVPPGFTFPTTRHVTLKVDAEQSLFRAQSVAGIEVTNAAHGLLFQGPLHKGQSLVVPLAIPTKDSLLNVTFRAPGVERTRSVIIVNDQATQIFM